MAPRFRKGTLHRSVRQQQRYTLGGLTATVHVL